MKETQRYNDDVRPLTVTTEDLRRMLGCGRDNAIRIATEAGARIEIGRRVLWNVDKVQKYLDSISK